ncbi:perforin-1-like [Poecilia latipinna]|uniref:perforin-1-like n=1 Tax=Poecilia latipinna TaxID=48699 RepID=UPI00072DD46E|nr:PREDICTED: perforin-1-like [Poecilia latipinna]XP_016533256.1 PREDICTED: perforin-1-like [Poecilia formosa]
MQLILKKSLCCSFTQIHTCLSMGVAVGLGKIKLSRVKKSCISILKNQDLATGYSSGLHQHFTEVSGGNGWLGEFSIFKNDSMGFMNWLKSLKEHPGVVSHSLRPLYQLMPSMLQKAAVKAAIEQYLKDNAVKKSPQEPHCVGRTPNVASNCCPQHASWGTLSVTIVRGWDLKGDLVAQTDGWVDAKVKNKDLMEPDEHTFYMAPLLFTAMPRCSMVHFNAGPKSSSPIIRSGTLGLIWARLTQGWF